MGISIILGKEVQLPVGDAVNQEKYSHFCAVFPKLYLNGACTPLWKSDLFAYLKWYSIGYISTVLDSIVLQDTFDEVYLKCLYS